MKRRPVLRTPVIAMASIAGTLLTSGCATSGNTADDQDPASTLTIYTDQHHELVDALTKAYTDKTGVKFDIQQDATYGQVHAEGKNSQADVFLSEDPAPVAMLGKDGLLEDIDSATLDQVQSGLSSQKKQWVAYAARTRVLYYNPEKIDEDELPDRLSDITDEKYKGKFAYAPSGAFQASVQYLLSTEGKAHTTEFLKALKANGVDEQKNGNVRDTVEAGKHAMGLSNHYYWHLKADEVGGAENMTSKIYHFPEEDPGNLIISSGAGILAASDHKDEAADFLQWLTAADGGQDIIAHDDVDVSGAQYPVAKGTSSDVVGSLDDVASPTYDMDIYADQSQAEKLLKSLGMTR